MSASADQSAFPPESAGQAAEKSDLMRDLAYLFCAAC